jgi:hypothetical protein
MGDHQRRLVARITSMIAAVDDSRRGATFIVGRE